MPPSAPGHPATSRPSTVWAQGSLPTSPHAFAGLAGLSCVLPAHSRGQQELGSHVLLLPDPHPLHHSACTRRQCSWALPLWIGEVLGSPRCSLALLHSWHLPSRLRCLPGPWLGQLLDPPHRAYTAQGPHPKRGAEPRGGLKLGWPQQRKAERLLSGWSPVHR